MPETLTALLFAHVLADFVLQPNWMHQRKRDPGILLAHGAVVLVLSQAAMGHVTSPEILVLVAAHLIIDAIKVYAGNDGLTAFLTDQIAHLVTIVAIAAYAPGLWNAGAWAGQSVIDPTWLVHAMILIAGGIFAVRAGGFAVGKLMEPHAGSVSQSGLPDGGRLIGLLERGLIFVLLLAGQAASIGFLIAAKSVMRFETASKEQKAAEYVIIGTLASFGWAIAVTLAALMLRDHLPPLEIGAARP